MDSHARPEPRILQSMKSIRIGTAGWNVPAPQAHRGGILGSHLERYATAMNCVEVNSSFYRRHRPQTWKKWAAVTPADFQFAVKAPKTITHTAKLQNCTDTLAQFFEEVAGLGEKLGPVLFQFAPSHVFDLGAVRDFLGTLREMHLSSVAFEPRNASWYTSDTNRLLCEYHITRVAADPPKGSTMGAKPGGLAGFRYYRLHGSPRTYWSAYDSAQIGSLAVELCSPEPGENWVIFDNTAAGAAFKNALDLMELCWAFIR